MVKGMILQIAPSSFGTTPPIDANLQTAIDELGFFKSIPAWLIVMIGALVIVGLSFVIVLQVYGRFFKVYMYAAVSPLILSSYAWVGMGGNTTRHFLKSFFGVCLEGLLIVVACLIYQSMVLNPAADFVAGDSPIMYLMQYMAQSIFNMLILIGTVKLTSTLVREMMGS